MAELHCLGAKFGESDAHGSLSSISAGAPSPFVCQPSGASSHTSLSLSPNEPLPPPTHDTTKSHHHMDNLQRFVDDLQLSAKRAFPNSTYSRYNEVQVLLIRWEEDELEVEYEMEELRKVFRYMYGFSTEQFLIPTQNSHRKLNHKVLSFVEEHEKEDILLIVYYGGHGVINKARQSTWSCKPDRRYATVEWSAIQTLFEMAKCDVLMLIDCCAGASAAPLTERPTNIKETIAACGFETWAPRPGPQSFTNTLIEVLSEWASQPAFSAAMLHTEILTRLKHAPPRRSSRGNFVESRKTPAYIVSLPDPHTASITLSRLLNEEACSATSSRAIPGSVLETLSEKVQGDSHISSEDRLETLLAMDEKGQRKAPHVLLTVALEEDQILDAASCARWLKQFPLLAKFVSVEGVYRSYSTLLLLSIPVVLWDLLPDHAAAQFVGYVRSRNLVPRNEPRRETTTPIPITGQSARKTTSGAYDCTSPLKSVSGLSSLDSGYDSSSISRPASLVTARLARKTTDGLGRLRNTLSSQVLVEKRQGMRYMSDLENPGQATSAIATVSMHTSRKEDASDDKAKRLVVTVGEAYLHCLNQDASELTCVLWYGHDVQHSGPLRQPSPKHIWNEEFRFEVDDSPMFYHLRLCVWAGQMFELIGELQIDLRSMVQTGQLPELREWQTLRRDGKTTGEIRIGLAYLSASEDGERRIKETKAKAKQQKQQQQLLQSRIERQARMEEMDFPVW